ncbi:sporulation initiation factor Spo0A C-terminal domain-containing protein [Lacrimispora amygdalina]|nr:sporulation initiation factor Spo0A C-terminal domain-containing protein [Clostridium indicum]
MRKIYRKIAKKNGVSVAEVKRDMQEAINAAYQNPPQDGGVDAAYQQRIPCKRAIPTPDEFIRYAANKIKTK